MINYESECDVANEVTDVSLYITLLINLACFKTGYDPGLMYKVMRIWYLTDMHMVQNIAK